MDLSRKAELLNCLSNIDENVKTIAMRQVDDMVFLEEQLENLRKMPLMKVHPQNPELQKPTTAGKLYKEYLQQYNNIVKNLCSLIRKEESTEDSPLREYFKRLDR